MKTKNLHNLILKLNELGKVKHSRVEFNFLCPADRSELIRGDCTCGADKHNSLVDEAAKNAIAELERISND